MKRPPPTEAGMRRRIQREMARHETRLGERGFPFGGLNLYLNNFHARLPGGYQRDLFNERELRQPYWGAGSSRKLRALTPARLFELIDRLIAELGLDAQTILGLRAARSVMLNEYVFPLYVRLRQEGFKHYPDLTA